MEKVGGKKHHGLHSVIYLSKTTHVTLSFSYSSLLLASSLFSYFSFRSFPGSLCAVVVALLSFLSFWRSSHL